MDLESLITLLESGIKANSGVPSWGILERNCEAAVISFRVQSIPPDHL